MLAPDDVGGLATRLAWLAGRRTEAAVMGRAAAERAHEYSWDAHARRVRELLDELARTPAGTE